MIKTEGGIIMRIIHNGKTAPWESRILWCPSCDCRFILENEDKNDLRLVKNREKGTYEYVIQCPECQQKFMVHTIEKTPL